MPTDHPIPLSKVYFGAEEEEALLRPLRSGWVVQGPEVARFEAAFTQAIGARHAIAVSNCSTALHLACRALGVGPGDEVIVPAFTWISTANAVEHCGAKAVFCDIDLATFNLDTAQIEAAITPRTVGIIPVHLFGLCADMTSVLAIAERHNLWVLEDAACALGSTHDGQQAGTLGRLACFSFHPRKSITTGEGGMITTNDDTLAKVCRSLRNHGASSITNNAAPGSTSLLPEYDQLGFNYRLTDLQGALGAVQMSRLPFLLSERRRCAAVYDDLLAYVPWLRTPHVPQGLGHSYQSYVTLFAPEPPTLTALPRLHEARNTLMQRLESEGISTRQGTHAPVRLTYYRDKYGLRPEHHPNAWMADALSLALPVYPGLPKIDMERVVRALSRARP